MRRFRIVSEARVASLEAPVQGARVGVEEQLVGIEAVTVLGRMGAVRAQAVARARRQSRHVGVPDGSASLRQSQPPRFPAAVLGEQAELDPGGVFREHRHIRARAVPVHAQGFRPAGPQFAPLLQRHAVRSVSSA